jgi:hypothetical protein
LNKLPKQNNENEALEEHFFIANCLRIGLKIEDLKQFEYKDIAKLMLCYIDENKPKTKKATQADWDKLARR